MTCPNMHLWNFWLDVNTIRETEVPTMQKEKIQEYQKSWLHHKGRNKHHFEYWIDYGINCDTIIKGVPMPRRYVAEMIMDRISASRVYLGDAYTDQAPYQYTTKKESGLPLGSSIPRHSRSSNFCCACSRNAAKTIPSITSATIS